MKEICMITIREILSKQKLIKEILKTKKFKEEINQKNNEI